MKKVFKTIGTLLPLAAVVLVPVMAGAQGTITPTEPIKTSDELVNTINRIAGLMQWGLLVLSGIFAIAAGYIYLTAAGDAEKVGKAKTMLIYTVIALAIGLLAGGIGSLVENLLGVSAPSV